jgi:hypothetical protein
MRRRQTAEELHQLYVGRKPQLEIGDGGDTVEEVLQLVNVRPSIGFSKVRDRRCNTTTEREKNCSTRYLTVLV